MIENGKTIPIGSEYPYALLSIPLAIEYGTVEALLISRIDSALDFVSSRPAKYKDKHFREGKWWIYKTYEQLMEEIPNIKERALRNKIHELERLEILYTDNFSFGKAAHITWYSLNYEKLREILELYSKPAKSAVSKPAKNADSEAAKNAGSLKNNNKRLINNKLLYSFSFAKTKEKSLADFFLEYEYPRDVECFLQSYANKYKDKFGVSHPPISLDALVKGIDNLLNNDNVDLLFSDCDVILDVYFSTQFSKHLIIHKPTTAKSLLA